jgi:membrane protein required for colicin V production
VEVDIALVVLLAAGFLLGVLRGAVRQLIVLGAWLVTFVVAAYLRPAVGDFIAGNTPAFSREHIDMLAFVSAFLVLFALAVIVIEIGGHTVQLTQRVAVDELLGGFLALGATLLAIASVVIAMDTYYLAGPPIGAQEHELVRNIHAAFERSSIVGAMHSSLIPGLIAILGIVLPADVRAVYA